MGYYLDYIEKNKNFSDNERESLMFDLKKQQEDDLQRQVKSYNRIYNVYVENQMFSHMQTFLFFPEKQKLITKMDRSKKELQEIRESSLPEHFESLFKKETLFLEEQRTVFSEQMANSISKTIKLNSHSLMETVASIFNKKETLEEESNEQFEEANFNEQCLKKAEIEWNSLSNIERTDVLLTRWQTEQTTILNPEDITKFFKDNSQQDVLDDTIEQ